MYFNCCAYLVSELLGPLNENLAPHPRLPGQLLNILYSSLVKCIHMTFYKSASSLNSLDIFSLFFLFNSFASRAKNVKNKPNINELSSDSSLVKRYARQIAKLEAELEVSMIYLKLYDTFYCWSEILCVKCYANVCDEIFCVNSNGSMNTEKNKNWIFKNKSYRSFYVASAF
jgi:hypothetical protein